MVFFLKSDKQAHPILALLRLVWGFHFRVEFYIRQQKWCVRPQRRKLRPQRQTPCQQRQKQALLHFTLTHIHTNAHIVHTLRDWIFPIAMRFFECLHSYTDKNPYSILYIKKEKNKKSKLLNYFFLLLRNIYEVIKICVYLCITIEIYSINAAFGDSVCCVSAVFICVMCVSYSGS